MTIHTHYGNLISVSISLIYHGNFLGVQPGIPGSRQSQKRPCSECPPCSHGLALRDIGLRVQGIGLRV